MVCLIVASCVQQADPSEEFSTLRDDLFVPTATCSVVEASQADRMLISTGPVGREQPLPDDIVFTKIVGESAAGWPHHDVATTGEGNRLNSAVNLSFYDDRPMEFEITSLPFRPDGLTDFALGVLVDVPADTELNPEMMFEISGIEYTTSGETYIWELERKAFLTRSFDDPEACARFENLDNDLNE